MQDILTETDIFTTEESKLLLKTSQLMVSCLIFAFGTQRQSQLASLLLCFLAKAVILNATAAQDLPHVTAQPANHRCYYTMAVATQPVLII